MFPRWGNTYHWGYVFPTWETRITRDRCFPGGEHISLGICVSQVGKHISLGICVSRVREHLLLGICVAQVGKILYKKEYAGLD